MSVEDALQTLPAQRVEHLVRQAMMFLDSDRQAALRFLNDASALLGLEERASDKSTFAPDNLFRPGGLARWQAKRTLTYIEENLGSKVDIADLANLVSFSKSHFSRAFKRSLGLSPMAYVKARRVERAKVLMASTRDQLSDIAQACGFSDQAHLSKSFRLKIGVSPGLWRRANVATTRTTRVRLSPPDVGNAVNNINSSESTRWTRDP